MESSVKLHQIFIGVLIRPEIPNLPLNMKSECFPCSSEYPFSKCSNYSTEFLYSRKYSSVKKDYSKFQAAYTLYVFAILHQR